MQIIKHSLTKTAFEDPLASFLGMPPFDPNSLVQAKKQVGARPYPRENVAKILEEYNRHLGNDPLAIENARKLALPDSCCVVAGQQLGMMGGPFYTILKGISCLLVARQTGAVPIFWLATEDHDIPEIDHTFMVDPLGNLKRFRLSLARDGTAVEDIVLNQKNIDEIQAFWSYLGMPDRPLPTPGEWYSRFMIRELISLFAGTGMVFLEPKLLRPLAIPFFSKEITECQAIQNVLNETTQRLEKAGGKGVIKVGEATNLFLKDKLHKRQKLRADGTAFTAGKENYTLSELLLKVQKEPELFSCNVAARPVLQNSLLPVIAYVAGPAEIAYHRQLGDYHQFHGVALPCLIPRISATFIPAHSASVLEACNLKPWEEIPHHLTGNAIHALRNTLYPHNQPQERVLNWWGFQAISQENLVRECLDALSWDSQSHDYIYL